MTEIFEGGCACGALRYKIPGDPVMQNHCQCRDCQQISGTGHGSYLTFARREQVALTGKATEWHTAGDSGNQKTRGFCPTCGSPVYLTFAAQPDLFVIHAASLDDPASFTPQISVYASRSHAWDPIAEDLPKFDRMPPG
ncbi:GFA family protein [Kiloniella laminariae]|uniref:GFA family protein n=1 Tax=Kiloniella laminariae TaxID=454162 RepID=UPI00036D00E0|nr:GFA family protein [Kiloniella laminariae]